MSAMMLAKAACLMTASASYVLCALPPPSSKTVNAQKDDKIVHEDWLIKLNVNKASVIMASIGVLETALYILLMIRGAVISNDVAIQQLQELKPWHLVMTGLCLAGFGLRKWSFISLDRFFTYQLTIRSGHRLVQSGPYTFLRHPSYTGATLNSICFHILLLSDGLWDVIVLFLSRAIMAVTQSKTYATAIPSSFMGIGGGTWLAAIYAYMWISMLSIRVKNEERMLKEHFGREWDEYASKRWRFIPLVY
ncbi:hypothetical protein EDD21DRAFT_369082 [Dissophora ornata]|nr:hypothetical protein BGZ58_009253 [Dissophora ornata]KAI8603445.1 hypothetical protein EDD21DRAFT_369082 [Dissophora ornata]